MRPAVRWMSAFAAVAVAAIAWHLSVSDPAKNAAQLVSDKKATPQDPALPHAIAVSAAPTISADTALKYRFLLSGLPADGRIKDRVRELLQEREDAADHDASTDQVSAIEAELLDLLRPEQRETYLSLRDSDAEQQALSEFAGGIAASSPLDEAQQRELLLAKLRHKQQYQTWFEHSGADRAELSPQERDYAQRALERALQDYRDGYLQEMRALLDDVQYTQLSDYERTEFAVALQRWQQSINER